jgi:peptide/nickel transport system substrate-binding protein
VKFHNGVPVTADTLRTPVERNLKSALGEADKNLQAVRSLTSLELEVDLQERSNFVTEALDTPISLGNEPTIGTGPFYIASTDPAGIELSANRSYYLGAPAIDTIELKPYQNFRAAWADMLRGRVDMLYEVGLEGLESLRPASNVRVFTYLRSYAYILVFNMRERRFKSAPLRHALNEAIDRNRLVQDALGGHAAPAEGPMWPDHWASQPSNRKFGYDPMAASKTIQMNSPHLSFVCSFPAAQPYERLAMVVQRQLRAVGVGLVLDPLPNDQFIARVTKGDFQAMMVDAFIGPTLLQEYQWWHSKGPRNFSRFSSTAIDAALDGIDRAPDEQSYKAGVGVFLNAIVDDPPAIFLAWGERARAVSTRFQVPTQTGRDILNAIRLFRPVVGDDATSRN